MADNISKQLEHALATLAALHPKKIDLGLGRVLGVLEKVKFNERITLASQQIDDATLLDVIERVRAANDGDELSFFEATTAAAFLAFSETPADIAIIEVGLGGRFDATNVFDPAVCAIAPIDYDHAEFLGRDLAGIAREKAGIIKPHVPVFIGNQGEVARAVLDGEAGKQRAPIQFLGEDFQAYRQHGRMVFERP